MLPREASVTEREPPTNRQLCKILAVFSSFLSPIPEALIPEELERNSEGRCWEEIS